MCWWGGPFTLKVRAVAGRGPPPQAPNPVRDGHVPPGWASLSLSGTSHSGVNCGPAKARHTWPGWAPVGDRLLRGRVKPPSTARRSRRRPLRLPDEKHKAQRDANAEPGGADAT